MEFRILGEVGIVGEDGPIVLTSSKHRALLGILLLRANLVVPRETIVDRLWNGSPPESASKLVQVYVSQLRRALGREGVRIVTRPPGYELVVEPDELDADRLERLLADGRAALAEGNPLRARRGLGEALALWRGDALADLADEEFARAEAGRLEELRVAATEERIEADLALGRHEDVIGELKALVLQHPLRERLWRQTMLALYRADRQAEALECFAESRRTFNDELGLEPGKELRELQAAILRQDESLAATARGVARPTNIGAPLSPLLGREHDVDELVALVQRDDVRLVTLVGAGGAGKTRLGVAVAMAALDRFANGAFMVELAPLRDPSLVPTAIAAALGFAPVQGETSAETLGRRLRGEEVLLVIDNAEHLAGVGPLLVEVLTAAPDVTLLVTSRSVLHLSGEHVFPVTSLARDDAVELFLTRAAAASAQFDRGATERQTVDEICALLDDQPLPIELAATRVRTLSPELLRERLGNRLPLLTGGSHDLPARQQTLRDTIDWSYDLLDEPAQALLAQLSVFAGGFTLDAAEQVCRSDDALTVLDALTTLLDASLVQHRPHQARFGLLETIREYAQERLDGSAGSETVRRRHAEHLVALARSARLTVESEGEMRHALVVPEADNIRAALGWAHDAGDAVLGLQLATALENYWVTHSPLEGAHWLGELLDLDGDLPAGLRAHALRAYASLTTITDPEVSIRSFEASLAEYRRLGDAQGVGTVLQRLGIEALRRGETAAARAYVEESLSLHRELGFAKGESVGLGVLGDVELAEGNDDLGFELLERGSALAEAEGFVWWRARTLIGIAEQLRERGRGVEAAARAQAALPFLEQMADRDGTVAALGRLARLAAEAGDFERAGRLWGAVEAEEARHRLMSWEQYRDRIAEDVLAHAEASFERGRGEGRELQLADAVQIAGAANRD